MVESWWCPSQLSRSCCNIGTCGVFLERDLNDFSFLCCLILWRGACSSAQHFVYREIEGSWRKFDPFYQLLFADVGVQEFKIRHLLLLLLPLPPCSLQQELPLKSVMDSFVSLMFPS